MRYEIGQRWFCERPPESYKPNFFFIIIGKGDRPNEKLCRVEIDTSDPRCRNISEGQSKPFEQPYSHKHLKKYAKLVEP